MRDVPDFDRSTADPTFPDPDERAVLDPVLEPVELPPLDVTAVPILHPSYQAVWLGYEMDESRAELGRLLPE